MTAPNPCCTRRHTKRAVRGAMRQVARQRMRELAERRALARADLLHYQRTPFYAHLAFAAQRQLDLIDAELVELARVVDGTPEGDA